MFDRCEEDLKKGLPEETQIIGGGEGRGGVNVRVWIVR
jgi:hypothetical protein